MELKEYTECNKLNDASTDHVPIKISIKNTKVNEKAPCIDCAKLWNNAPTEVKNGTTKASAKKEIKKFTMTLEL